MHGIGYEAAPLLPLWVNVILYILALVLLTLPWKKEK